MLIISTFGLLGWVVAFYAFYKWGETINKWRETVDMLGKVIEEIEKITKERE